MDVFLDEQDENEETGAPTDDKILSEKEEKGEPTEESKNIVQQTEARDEAVGQNDQKDEAVETPVEVEVDTLKAHLDDPKFFVKRAKLLAQLLRYVIMSSQFLSIYLLHLYWFVSICTFYIH